MAFVERLHLLRFRDPMDLGDGILLREQTAPTTPPANQLHLYSKDSGGVAKLFYKDDAGTEVGPLGGGTVTGSGTTNRLAYWSAATVLAANAALTQGHVLFADVNGLPLGETNLFWDAANDRLGIGTTAPDFDLDIKGSVANIQARRAAANDRGPAFVFQKARGSIAAPTKVLASDELGEFNFGGHDGSTYNFDGARIAVRSPGDWSTTSRPTELLFETTPTGSTTRAERLRIEASGDISHASVSRHRMLSQNRFRHLNIIAQVSRATAQSIATNTPSAVQWNAEQVDTDAIHDNVTNNTRLTVAMAGKYLICANILFQANATGRRGLLFHKNGTNLGVGQYVQATGADETGVSAAIMVSLAANDYVEVLAQQFSGGNLNVLGDDTFQSCSAASIAYIGE